MSLAPPIRLPFSDKLPLAHIYNRPSHALRIRYRPSRKSTNNHKHTTSPASRPTMKIKLFTTATAATLVVVVSRSCYPPAHFASNNTTAEYNETLSIVKRQCQDFGCIPMPCHDGHMHCCYDRVSRSARCSRNPFIELLLIYATVRSLHRQILRQTDPP